MITDKYPRSGEVDAALAATLTQVQGCRSHKHESARPTEIPDLHSRPPSARRPAAHYGNTPADDDAHSLTLTDLFSGGTETHAVWSQARHAILTQSRLLEAAVLFPLRRLHNGNGSKPLNRLRHK